MRLSPSNVCKSSREPAENQYHSWRKHRLDSIASSPFRLHGIENRVQQEDDIPRRALTHRPCLATPLTPRGLIRGHFLLPLLAQNTVKLLNKGARINRLRLGKQRTLGQFRGVLPNWPRRRSFPGCMSVDCTTHGRSFTQAEVKRRSLVGLGFGRDASLMLSDDALHR